MEPREFSFADMKNSRNRSHVSFAEQIGVRNRQLANQITRLFGRPQFKYARAQTFLVEGNIRGLESTLSDSYVHTNAAERLQEKAVVDFYR